MKYINKIPAGTKNNGNSPTIENIPNKSQSVKNPTERLFISSVCAVKSYTLFDFYEFSTIELSAPYAIK